MIKGMELKIKKKTLKHKVLKNSKEYVLFINHSLNLLFFFLIHHYI